MLKNIIFCVLILSFQLNKCDAIENHVFHSETNGYSFQLPNEWKQVPEEVVRRYNENLSRSARSIVVYEAEFTRQINDENSLPSIIIQVSKYSNLNLSRAPREDEFGDFVKAITGRNVMEVKDKLFDEKIADIILGYGVSQVRVDKARRCYRFISDITMGGSEQLRSEVVGYFGKEALVQLSFNHYPQADWAKFESDRNIVFGSFKFDPMMAYQEHAVRRSVFDGWLVDVAIYGIVALVIFLVGMLVRVFKSPSKHGANQDIPLSKE